MSAWEIATSLTSALAWPVAVLVVAVLYRRPISKLLGTGLGKMRLGPLSVEWDRVTDEIERELPPDRMRANRSRSSSKMFDVASFEKESPRGVILRAYETVEQALTRKLGPRSMETTLTHPSALQEAERRGVIPPATLRAVRGLQVLRNLALYAPQDEPVTPERAKEFMAIAEAVLFALEGDEGERTSQEATP